MPDHALHNEEVCTFIYSQKKYHDWTVTTAFYSALHFVQFEIFPFDNGHGDRYPNFAAYFNDKVVTKGGRMSKHEATYQLVTRNLKTCGPQYKWLMDTCQTARYNNYNISEAIAKEAVDNLAYIKSRLKKFEALQEQKAT